MSEPILDIGVAQTDPVKSGRMIKTCGTCTHAKEPNTKDMRDAGFIRCNAERKAYLYRSPFQKRDECRRFALLTISEVLK